jgi:hypothetical protein
VEERKDDLLSPGIVQMNLYHVALILVRNKRYCPAILGSRKYGTLKKTYSYGCHDCDGAVL